jgi:glycosyltransferase involved in cell wall biosynthesis
VTTFALSAYPISGSFRAGLERLAGEPIELVVLPELRRLGPHGLVRRLAALRGRCLVVLEDPSSVTLLPVLEALALATRAGRIEVVRDDLSLERRSRFDGIVGVAGLGLASVDAQRALRRARRELDALARAPRIDARTEGRRALFLNANLWFGVKAGGSIAHAAGVVDALAGRGWDVTVATAPEPVGIRRAADVVRLEPPAQFGLPVESNLYRFGLTVPDQVTSRRRQPSIVYQRHSVGSFAGVQVSRRTRAPLVLEYNGSEVWVARNWGRPLRYESLALAAEEASFRHAHLVVTVSQALADELVARGVEQERVVWHPNGVDADRFAPASTTPAERDALRGRYRIPRNAVLITFVGTFGRWHGAHLLARAVREQAAWARANDVRFLFVGDGLTMPQVRADLEALDDVATLAGLVPPDDVPLHLAASDVLVSPHVPNDDGSAFFGSPTKIFEYMAAGKAIVASDLDQVGDVLRDDLAILVRPGDVEDLARGLREAAADASRRDELGRRARDRVRDRYTWSHHVSAILAALERVTGRT